MFKNSKHAFWEALVLTIMVFIIGIFIGIAYENSQADRINQYYAISEVSLMDSLAFNNLVDLGYLDCETFIKSQINFADSIYDEALILERFEDSGRITGSVGLTHQRYDLLRTLLWTNMIGADESCKQNISTVVYLYEFNTEDLAQKATQTVWSRILFDLKQERGDNIILIPIAVDSNLVSLNSLLDDFQVSKYPAVIIDEEHIIHSLNSVEELEVYF